jgi:hypothetical protein
MNFPKAVPMKIFSAITVLLALGSPAMAEMVMTIAWPSQTRDGDRYIAEVISYDSEVTGYFLITASPNDSIEMPMGDAAKMCMYPLEGAKPLGALRGPFHDQIIPVVPSPETGKLCISLFEQKSGTWQVEF